MYLGHWDVSLDPIQQNVLTEVYINLNTTVQNCSGGDQFIHRDGCSSHSNRTHAITKKKAYSLAEQRLLTQPGHFLLQSPSVLERSTIDLAFSIDVSFVWNKKCPKLGRDLSLRENKNLIFILSDLSTKVECEIFISSK